GSALALVAQQQFGENTVLWSQYLYSAESIGPASREWTMGLSIAQCFGRKNDGFGIAIGWSAPSDEYYPGWRENLQLEAYYRCQVTHSWQLSPDFQVFRPSDPQASGSAVFSFALRLLTTF
ncbi:MAG: carbohydrate porin, partial [Planctomycetota bacterium]|nr:carbohydrate porin [Planctomycetota bacterium]